FRLATREAPACAAHPGRSKRLTLRELLPATCLVETDLLTFDFTRIARNKAGARQLRLQRRGVVHQGTRDAVTNRACLTRFATAGHIDLDVERGGVARQFERLAHDHQRRFAREIISDRLAIDDD